MPVSASAGDNYITCKTFVSKVQHALHCKQTCIHSIWKPTSKCDMHSQYGSPVSPHLKVKLTIVISIALEIDDYCPFVPKELTQHKKMTKEYSRLFTTCST